MRKSFSGQKYHGRRPLQLQNLGKAHPRIEGDIPHQKRSDRLLRRPALLVTPGAKVDQSEFKTSASESLNQPLKVVRAYCPAVESYYLPHVHLIGLLLTVAVQTHTAVQPPSTTKLAPVM